MRLELGMIPVKFGVTSTMETLIRSNNPFSNPGNPVPLPSMVDVEAPVHNADVHNQVWNVELGRIPVPDPEGGVCWDVRGDNDDVARVVDD